MATMSNSERSTSGKLRRAIGISRRVLIQRTEALRGAVQRAVGEEDFYHLSKEQCESICLLDDDETVDSFDFLYDARSEVANAHTKLQQQHLEFTSLARTSPTEREALEIYVQRYGDYTADLERAHSVILLADIVLDEYTAIANERDLDLSPPEETLSEIATEPKAAPSQTSSRILTLTTSTIPNRPRPPSRTQAMSTQRNHSEIHPSNPIDLPDAKQKSDDIHQSDANRRTDASNQSGAIHQNTSIPYAICPCSPSNPHNFSANPATLSHFASHQVFPHPTLLQQSGMAGRILPPTFNGDITLFAEFKESFESMFGTLDEIAKLAMLESCLGPEPKRLISGLRRIDRNFTTAMIILKKEYDKSALIRHTLLSRIRLLEPCDEDGSRLRETYLALSEIIHQLVPDEADDTSELLSNMILSKLPSSIQCRVFMQYGSNDRPIRSFDILKMVAVEVEKERIEAAIKNGSRQPNRPIPLDLQQSRTSPESDQNQSNRMRENRSMPFCRLCELSGHYPDSCTSYSTPRDRLTVVLHRGLCHRCLASSHSTSDCRNPRRCKVCSDVHHTAICESTPTPSSVPIAPTLQPRQHTTSQALPAKPINPINSSKPIKPTSYAKGSNRKPTDPITTLAFDAFDYVYPTLRFDDHDDHFL